MALALSSKASSSAVSSSGLLVDEDHDEAETSYYEFFADPDVQALDNAQRSYAGQYLRRLRRRREQERHRDETRRRGARRRRLH
jgi:hypothetical protein